MPDHAKRVSHASPIHALKRAHTSAGRKIIIPSRFIESVELYKMGAKCEYCGVEYANRRNFKRHVNATHSENVKYVTYCIDNCDIIFFAGYLKKTDIFLHSIWQLINVVYKAQNHGVLDPYSVWQLVNVEHKAQNMVS